MIVERHGTIAQIFEKGGEGVPAAGARHRGGARGPVGLRHLDGRPVHARRAQRVGADADERASRSSPSPRRLRAECSRTASRRGRCWPTPRTPCSIKDMVEQRRAGYARFATVTTDGRNPDDIVEEIRREGAADGTGANGRVAVAGRRRGGGGGRNVRAEALKNILSPKLADTPPGRSSRCRAMPSMRFCARRRRRAKRSAACPPAASRAAAARRRCASISRVSARTAFARRAAAERRVRRQLLAARVRRALGLPRRLVGRRAGGVRARSTRACASATRLLTSATFASAPRAPAQRRLRLRRRRRARARSRSRPGSTAGAAVAKAGASRDASAIRWRQRSDCRSTVRRSCGAMLALGAPQRRLDARVHQRLRIRLARAVAVAVAAAAVAGGRRLLGVSLADGVNDVVRRVAARRPPPRSRRRPRRRRTAAPPTRIPTPRAQRP